jgi:hypothetical protein
VRSGRLGRMMAHAVREFPKSTFFAWCLHKCNHSLYLSQQSEVYSYLLDVMCIDGTSHQLDEQCKFLNYLIISLYLTQ